MATETCSENLMQAAVASGFGGPEVLGISLVPRPVLQSRQLLIRAVASAVNRADTLQRKGAYPPPPGVSDIIGLEVSGVVVDAAPDCIRNLSVGSRVAALLGGGGYAEYVAVDERHVLVVPDSMSLLEAAAVPEAWLTAFQLIHFIAKVQPGETVLVHAGASGVGTAIIQLIKQLGGISIATVGSQEKQQEVLSLGAIAAVNYKAGPWVEEVRKATQGRGVDVVFDCIGESYVEQNADILVVDGRWVLYGTMSGPNVSGPFLRKLLSKRISILPTTLRARSNEYKASLIEEFATKAWPEFETKQLKTLVSKTFKLSQAGDAHRFMEENANTGKILLKISEE